MPALEIRLQSGREVENVPLSVEIIDEALEPKWKGAIRVGAAEKIDGLKEGLYRVEASLPSGHKSIKVVKISQSDVQVELPIIQFTPSESLNWTDLLRTNTHSEMPSPEKFGKVWFRLWERPPDGSWRVVPLPSKDVEREIEFVQYTLLFQSEGRLGQYYLQVGGPNMRWRFVALPADDIRVLITPTKPSTSPEEDDSTVDISLANLYPDADVLIGYLRSGAIDQARTVSNIVIDEDLLEGKRNNPIAVAIAGYYLIRINDLSRLRKVYMTNLANWSTWLPDSAVVDAWYLMRASPPDFERARERLLEATARGMPIYYRGLQLLTDSLILFQGDPKYSGPDIEAALTRVRRYASAADRRATTTTFIGVHPEMPGVERFGVPEDTQPLSFFLEKDQSRAVSFSLQAYPGMPLLTDVPSPNLLYERLVDTCAEARCNLREANRREHIDKLRSGRLDVDDRQRTIARLLRAEDIETQTERLTDSSPLNLNDAGPVKLLTVLENPLQLRGLAVERIAGRSNVFSVSYLSRGRAAAWTVGCLAVPSPSQNIMNYGSAFLVSPRLLLSCHRLLSSIDMARTSTVDFDFEERTDKELKRPKRFKLDPDVFFVTNEKLDFTIVALSRSEKPLKWGWIPLKGELGKVIIGEWLSVIQHVDGAPKQLSLRSSRLVDVVDEFLHFEDEGLIPSLGAPFFNDQWEVVGIHHASIPAKDTQGHVIARNGKIWNGKTMESQQIQWSLHECVRISSIVRFISDFPLPAAQAELRDELLYGKSPLSY